jgi:glycosyltransferase involved in cell wall biosynthesis
VTAPGCDEVVRDGETGILTKNDPAGLAEAAIGLLLDGERRAAMGVRARQVAEREFDVALQISRTLDVYADVQARAAAAARRG